jgi:8-oxo-dGTP diphosphatase
MSENIFNVRVYGILINEQKQVLVTDEIHYGQRITKFPGGGLQFGEGTIDCLKRECMEELGREVEVREHFYTTDFFQRSAFNKKQQVISIYYFISIRESQNIPVTQKAFEFDSEQDGAQIFRWIDLALISENDFTFPIEKKVAELLRKKWSEEKIK